jgi:hypothetical protein
VNNKMLALYGLKWNPFAPSVPTEALHSPPAWNRSVGGCINSPAKVGNPHAAFDERGRETG